MLSAARGLFVNFVALLSCQSYIRTIHVQYLCKGGMKLLQRQFERLLASKQLRRPPEGAFFFLCTLNIFSNTVNIVHYTSIGTSFLLYINWYLVSVC